MDTQLLTDLSEALKLQAGTVIIGWLLFIVGLVVKDMLTALAFGIMFFLDPQFQEGDTVYIDDDEAIIQKIGLYVTIFKIVSDNKWRYIRNEKIRYHKLEKQVEKEK